MNSDISASSRMESLDIARAIAVLFMVPVNYAYVIAPADPSPAWIWDGVHLITGRAAALFVVLAGIGISLLAKRGTTSNCRSILLRRALALGGMGFAFSWIWPADILEFYAIFLISAALILRLSSAFLIGATAATLAGAVLLHLTMDYSTGWNYETFEYENMWAPVAAMRRLAFNGYHPYFPWFAFIPIGMLIGRLDLNNRRVQAWLLFAGVLTAGLLETASHFARPDEPGTTWNDVYAVTLTRTAMPASTLYVLASAATAVAIIAACALFTPHAPRLLRKPFVHAGELTLTLYLAHGIVGTLVDHLQLTFGFDPLIATMAWCAGFALTGIAMATAWRRRFAHGPAEALLRALAPSRRHD